MSENLTPSSANEPLRPEPPHSNEWWKEVVALFQTLVDKASEEALVIIAVLLFKVVMELRGLGGITTDLLAFSALGSYLTLRLVNLFVRRS